MQWHLGRDTDLSLPAWLGPRKQRIMILGDRGPLFFPFERAQGKRSTKKTMSLQSLCAILAHFSKQKHDLKHEVPSVVNQFDKFLCSHVWHAEFPFGMALVAEACRAWNTCFATDECGAEPCDSQSSENASDTQEIAGRDAEGSIHAALNSDGGYGGQISEPFNTKDLPYNTIPSGDKDTEGFFKAELGNSSSICLPLEGEPWSASWDDEWHALQTELCDIPDLDCFAQRKMGGNEQLEENHDDAGELTAAAARGGQNFLEAKQIETIAEGFPCSEGCSKEMPTGASKDLNHLVTRKGPAVAGERPCGNEVGLRTPTTKSGCQAPTGEVASSLQCSCCARSGCQVPTGEVAGALQCDCCVGSGCQVPTGDAACAMQSAWCARAGCQGLTGEVAGATQRACSAQLGCKVPTSEVTGALQHTFCERSGCQVPSGVLTSGLLAS